jgi:TPR repeat protein
MGNEYNMRRIPKREWDCLRLHRGHIGARMRSLDINDYLNGWGVPKDYVLAYMWWNLAAAQGHENAVKVRDLVAGVMTPADISEAQRLAREWLEEHQ